MRISDNKSKVINVRVQVIDKVDDPSVSPFLTGTRMILWVRLTRSNRKDSTFVSQYGRFHLPPSQSCKRLVKLEVVRHR